jgi:hypothetical protein
MYLPPCSPRRPLFLLACILVACLLAPAEVGSRQQAKGKRYALLVGVRDYDHRKLDPLRHTENDAEELGKVLRTGGYAEVIVLTTTRGEKSSNARPTAANIRARLEDILKRVNRHDLVLIALAGHGLQLGVRVGGKTQDESFFCPSDAQPRSNLELKEAETTLIGLTSLFRQLDESGAGVKLLLVDACRNDPFVGRSVDTDGLPRPPTGTAALFSCKGGERAFETDKLGKGHGIFFFHVIDGLKGKATNKRGEITWSSLTDHVVERVSVDVPRLIQSGARQTPQEIKNITGLAPVLVDTIARKDGPTVAVAPKKEPKEDVPAAVVVPQVKGETRGYLGVRVYPGKDGVYVVPSLGGPGEQAGISRGDALVEMNRQKVHRLIDVLRILEATRPNMQLPVRIRRGPVERDLKVTLGTVPYSVDSDPSVSDLARAVNALERSHLYHELTDSPFQIMVTLRYEADVERLVKSGADGQLLHLNVQLGATTPRSLARLKDLKHLGGMLLFSRESNDNVLRDLAGLQIEDLNLARDKLSDAGLAHLRSHPSLRKFGVYGTFTDGGLVHLKHVPKLESLNLGSPALTDAGLVHLECLANLKEVFLSGQVSDARVAAVARLSRLEKLILRGNAVTDAGLAPLARLRHLRYLILSSSKVGDAGLRHLSKLTALQLLDLRGTGVTDGGLGALAGLPIVVLNLQGCRIRDAGLRHLKECPALSTLWLDRTPVTDAGMVHLAQMKQLRELHLRQTKVSGKGLVHLARLPDLLILDMVRAGPVRNEDLHHLASMPNLRALTLSGPDLTPTELGQLKGMRSLGGLYVYNPKLKMADFKTLTDAIPGLSVSDPSR